MPSRLATEKAAQAWCTPTTEKIVMIPELAEAFANILDKVWGVLKCAYCGEPITPGTEWYLDKSGVDGAFCCELHAEAHICRIVELIDNEDSDPPGSPGGG